MAPNGRHTVHVIATVAPPIVVVLSTAPKSSSKLSEPLPSSSTVGLGQQNIVTIWIGVG
nr:unnamed protein product [Digitaria exilis]